MRFDLGEDIAALRDMVHRWAQERVKPLAARTDRDQCLPERAVARMGELGLLGITVPEEYGGSGMGYLAHTIAVEEIARASASDQPVLWRAFQPVREPDQAERLARAEAKYLPKLFPASMSARWRCPRGRRFDVVGMKLRAKSGTATTS
jgi:isovaleryl-CoA dehydrogenase